MNKFKIFILPILTSFTLFSSMLYSQVEYYYTNSFEYSLISPSNVFNNQYIADEYCSFPNRTDSSQINNQKKFGLNSYLLVNPTNFTFNLTPQYRINNFILSINIPYNLLIWDAVKNLGDIYFKTSYSLNFNKLTNTSSLGFSIPTGYYKEYTWYLSIRNGSGTCDIHFSNHLQLDFNRYGIYTNFNLRYGLFTGSQDFTYIPESGNYPEDTHYKFKNGTVSSLTCGTYFEPFNRFRLHLGIGTIYNHLNKFIKTSYDLIDNSTYFVEVNNGDQQFLYSDIRFGLTYQLRKLSFSLFIMKPIVQKIHKTTYRDFEPVFRINWKIF